MQRTYTNNKKILVMKKVGGIILHDFKTQYKAKVIKTVIPNSRQIDLWDRTDCPEVGLYSSLFSTKVIKLYVHKNR